MKNTNLCNTRAYLQLHKPIAGRAARRRLRQVLEIGVRQLLHHRRLVLLEPLVDGILVDRAVVQQRHAVPEEHERRLLGRTVQLAQLAVVRLYGVGVQRLLQVGAQADELLLEPIAVVAVLLGCVVRVRNIWDYFE